MQLHSSKAIVLRSAYLKEQQKILTLFSEQFGVISLVIQKRAKQAHCLSEPFCEGEFFFWPGSSDLKKYHDGSILDLHLGLRNQLGYLKTASAMAKAISTSQMPEKASLPIYALFSSFLKQIPRFPLQETLLTCFYLKILRYEGLYHKDCEIFRHLKTEQRASRQNSLRAKLRRIKRRMHSTYSFFLRGEIFL